MQWRYKDFKPKDPIDVRYYITQFPRLPEEVDAFVDALLSAGTTLTELEEMNQVLLSTYGKEPEERASEGVCKRSALVRPSQGFFNGRSNPRSKSGTRQTQCQN